MTSQYARGAEFERKVRDRLESCGYEVIRSAGSKTKVDLVAIGSKNLLLVQCKLNGLCPPAERAKLRSLADMACALPIVAYKATEGRARPIRFRLLVGDGPKEFCDWQPYEGMRVLKLEGTFEKYGDRLAGEGKTAWPLCTCDHGYVLHDAEYGCSGNACSCIRFRLASTGGTS